MKYYKLTLYAWLLWTCIACQKKDQTFPVPTLKSIPFDPVFNHNSEYILVLGDVQEYTGNAVYAPYFASTINWIYSQYLHGIKIKYILQTGDITWGNRPRQYKVYQQYTDLIAEYIPMIACVGNHDYTYDEKGEIVDRYSSLFTEYITPCAQNWPIASYFEPRRLENIVVSGQLQQMPYDILCLEFGPRSEVIAWANRYVASHRDRKFILLTHEFLTRNGERINKGSYAELQLRNTSYSTPEQLWQKLIKNNDNILCVLCGHNGFMQHLFSKNSTGREVAQMLFNLQYQANGGDGWIQLWEIPADRDSIHVQTYNTIRRTFSSDPVGTFKFKYR